MISARYTYACAPVDVTGANCVTSPQVYTALYPSFFSFWYRQINSSGFSPYDNTPIPTSDPALASVCLCALAMGFALASIVVTSANAAAMKREILDLPPYDKSLLVFKGCRYCPPPGHTYTVQRGVLFNSLAFVAQVSGWWCVGGGCGDRLSPPFPAVLDLSHAHFTPHPSHLTLRPR